MSDDETTPGNPMHSAANIFIDPGVLLSSSASLPVVTELPLDTASALVGHVEEEVERRRERLRQLRKRRQQQSENGVDENAEHSTKETNVDGDDDDCGDELPHVAPLFRNYKPQSEELSNNLLDQPELVQLLPMVQEQLEAGKTEKILDEVNLTNLAPRKPDWDLKRAVEKKLKKLERRTQRAIAELIRERLQTEKDMDLATALQQQP